MDAQAAHVGFRLESEGVESAHLAGWSPCVKARQENRATELACDWFTKSSESFQTAFSFMGKWDAITGLLGLRELSQENAYLTNMRTQV